MAQSPAFLCLVRDGGVRACQGLWSQVLLGIITKAFLVLLSRRVKHEESTPQEGPGACQGRVRTAEGHLSLCRHMVLERDLPHRKVLLLLRGISRFKRNSIKTPVVFYFSRECDRLILTFRWNFFKQKSNDRDMPSGEYVESHKNYRSPSIPHEWNTSESPNPSQMSSLKAFRLGKVAFQIIGAGVTQSVLELPKQCV